MSSIAPLFTLLLALSISTCTARHLRVMHAKDSSTYDDEFNTAFEKVNLDENPVHGKSAPSASLQGVAANKPKDSRDLIEKNEALSSSVQNPSLVKVSWRVPHGGLQKDPGFVADYVGPKTHPPSHN